MVKIDLNMRSQSCNNYEGKDGFNLMIQFIFEDITG